jgi:hypothetical protein
MSDLYQLPHDAKAGSIYLSKNLDASKDVVITFDYACYGAGVSGSEGFCVFLFDTNVKFLSGGGPGAGLCYAPTSNITATLPSGEVRNTFDGVNGALLGIGFDLTGTYGTTAFGADGYHSELPNSITIRGSQSHFYAPHYRSDGLSSFEPPISLYQQITDSSEPVYKTVRIRLTDFCTHVIIDYKNPITNRFVNYIDTYVKESFPISVNCCLSFATGLADTCLSVKNFSVNGTFTSLTSTPILFTWSYNISSYMGTITPNPGVLGLRDTIEIVNAPPYGYIQPLILVSKSGGAPLQNYDGYVKIEYHN